MAEIEFTYNGNNILIQCKIDEIINDIIQKFLKLNMKTFIFCMMGKY